MINIESIHKNFYIKENNLYWKYAKNPRMLPNTLAGKVFKDGIRYVKFNGIKYKASDIIDIILRGSIDLSEN